MKEYKEEIKEPMVYEFDPVIYPRRLYIAVTTDQLKKRFDGVCEWEDSFNAVVENVNDNQKGLGGVLMRFHCIGEMTAEIMAHESVHAACNILDYVGSKVETNNQEHLAYLVGWIAKCCEEVKNKENKHYE